MATKRAPKKADKPVETVVAATITHVLHDYARPSAGSRLAAHTAAFLKLSGMADGKACPGATALKVIGPTAVKYHRLIGNWESTKDGLKLAEKGRAFFAARGEPDLELLAAYVEVLSTGAVNEKVVKDGNVVKLS